MTDFERMRVLIRQEERYRWAVEKQTARAGRITASISQTGRSGQSKTDSRVEEGAIMLAALKDEYKEILDELTEARAELRGTISRIKQARARLGKSCLRMRYLQGMSVRQIATSLNYSEQHIHMTLHAAEETVTRIQKAQEQKSKSELT